MLGNLRRRIRDIRRICILRSLKYWNYERKNELPHPQEIMGMLNLIHQNCLDRISRAAMMYAVGLSLEEIANHFGVTRERIRQLVLKARRQGRVAHRLREAL